MDGSLREEGALEEGERGAHLIRQAVLEDEARPDVGSFGEGEKFGGARVDVGFIHAARVHEAGGHGDAEVGEGGEGFAIGEVALAAEAFAAAGVGVSGRIEVVFEPGVGGALGLEDGDAVFGCGGHEEFLVEVIRDGRVGWRDGGVVCVSSHQWAGPGCTHEGEQDALEEHGDGSYISSTWFDVDLRCHRFEGQGKMQKGFDRVVQRSIEREQTLLIISLSVGGDAWSHLSLELTLYISSY